MATSIRVSAQEQTVKKSARQTYYFKFYGDKWRSGTVAMGLEAKGLYIDIISLMWDRKGCLPACPLALARLLKVDPRVCRRVLAQLIGLGKLRVDGDRLTNKRMGHEIAVYLSTAATIDAAADQPPAAAEIDADDQYEFDLFANATGGMVDTTTDVLPPDFRQKSSHIFLENSTKTTPAPLQLESELKQENKKKENSTAAPVPVSAAPPDILFELLLEAAGSAVEVTAPGIGSTIEPRAWLANGCHLDADVLPAIRAVAARPRRSKIVSWQYFRQAVAEARAARTTPLAVIAVDGCSAPRMPASGHAKPAWVVEKERRRAESKRILADLSLKYAATRAAVDAAYAQRQAAKAASPQRRAAP